ncbi:hypothetical protein JCM1840_007033, partial [Sporobolomyces johnsonii]
MPPQPRKRQRTTSTNSEDAPSTPSASALKACISKGSDAADMETLLHTISTCRAKANGYQFFHPPTFCDPPQHDDDSVAFVIYKCKTPKCNYTITRLVTSAPSAQLYSHGFRCADKDKGKPKEWPVFEGMGPLEARE